MTDTEAKLRADGGMNIEPHDGDMIREAINREEYIDHRALGEIDGYEVLVVSRVSEATLSGGFHPKLTVHIGGEWDNGTYLGGSTVRKTFDTLWELDEAFEELFVEHDLELIEGVGADE